MTRLEIPIKRSISESLEAVRKSIGKLKGQFEGNESSGTFSSPSPFGDVEGRYSVTEAKVLVLEITKKPFLISDSLIESYLTEYLNGD
jgi:hypothetical protein